jgi:hypothetical protein
MNRPKSIPGAHKRRDRGHAVVEISLLAPWILFLFVGTLDLGFYSYALICTQKAARVAVTHTSSRSATAADSAIASPVRPERDAYDGQRQEPQRVQFVPVDRNGVGGNGRRQRTRQRGRCNLSQRPVDPDAGLDRGQDDRHTQGPNEDTVISS